MRDSFYIDIKKKLFSLRTTLWIKLDQGQEDNDIDLVIRIEAIAKAFADEQFHEQLQYEGGHFDEIAIAARWSLANMRAHEFLYQDKVNFKKYIKTPRFSKFNKFWRTWKRVVTK